MYGVNWPNEDIDYAAEAAKRNVEILGERCDELERDNSELRECLREAVSEMCAAYCDERGLKCRKEQGKCFVQKWVNALAKAAGEEAR